MKKNNYTFEPNHELLSFAETFASNWNIVGPGDYVSPGEKKYHIKYVDKITTDGIELPQNIVFEPQAGISGMIVISKSKLEKLETTNQDYLFYMILWCVVQKEVNNELESDAITMEFCMKAGCSVKNIMTGFVSAISYPSTEDDDVVEDRIESLISFVKLAYLKQKQKKINIIVAIDENNVIGKDNSLIWHLPADMKFFKEKTTNHIVITGRKNYESIPEKFRPLPNRANIVITRQKDYYAPGATVVGSIDEAIKMSNLTDLPDKEIFIIGGAEIYNQCLGLADKLYVTKLYHSFKGGDVFFPAINTDTEWKETDRKKGIVDEKNKYEHDFITYEKQ